MAGAATLTAFDNLRQTQYFPQIQEIRNETIGNHSAAVCPGG